MPLRDTPVGLTPTLVSHRSTPSTPTKRSRGSCEKGASSATSVASMECSLIRRGQSGAGSGAVNGSSGPATVLPFTGWRSPLAQSSLTSPRLLEPLNTTVPRVVQPRDVDLLSSPSNSVSSFLPATSSTNLEMVGKGSWPRPSQLPVLPRTSSTSLQPTHWPRQPRVPRGQRHELTSPEQTAVGGITSSHSDRDHAEVRRPSLLSTLRTLRSHLHAGVVRTVVSAGASNAGAPGELPTVQVSLLDEPERKALLSMCRMVEQRVISQEAHHPFDSERRLTAVEDGDLKLQEGSLIGALTLDGSDEMAMSHGTGSITSTHDKGLPTFSLDSRGSQTGVSTLSATALLHRRTTQPPGILTSPTDMARDAHERASERVHRAAGRFLILLDSWQHISACCYRAFAEVFFADMLRARPDYAQLFVGTSIAHQALAVMDMMGRAVMAYVDPTEFMALMSELGARHRFHGVSEEHYQAMQEAFLANLAVFLPAGLWRDSEAAWKGLWQTMTELMLFGARSARGDLLEVQRTAGWITEVQKLMRAVRPVESADANSIREHTFPLTMYNTAIADRPELSIFANMATVRTGDRLMNSIYFIVEHLTDSDQSSLEEYIKLVSARHEEYKVTAEALQDFANYYVATVEGFLRKLPEGVHAQLWTPHSRRHLLSFWHFLIDRWARSCEQKQERTTLLRRLALDGSQPITFVFTDIEQSTSLWEVNRAVMACAVRQHHALVRSLIADIGAFEVKTVGDSFMVACANPVMALKLAMGIQLELMRHPIAPGFVMCDGVVGQGDPTCWRDDSLRVRVGIHMGSEATPVYDAVHNRYDYYGPVVNCAARVESAAAGGQTLMTWDCACALATAEEFTSKPVPWQLRTFEDVDAPGYLSNVTDSSTLRRRKTFNKGRTFEEFVLFYESADLHLRGINHPVKVLSVVPRALEGREFPGQGRLTEIQTLLVDNKKAERCC